MRDKKVNIPISSNLAVRPTFNQDKLAPTKMMLQASLLQFAIFYTGSGLWVQDFLASYVIHAAMENLHNLLHNI